MFRSGDNSYWVCAVLICVSFTHQCMRAKLVYVELFIARPRIAYAASRISGQEGCRNALRAILLSCLSFVLMVSSRTWILTTEEVTASPKRLAAGCEKDCHRRGGLSS